MGRNAVCAVTLALFLVAFSGACRNGACVASAVRNQEIPAQNVNALSIISGPGDLEVRGGAGRVLAVGHVCAPDQATADKIVLYGGSQGDNTTIEARFPFTVAATEATMNLSIKIPTRVDVSVINRSGDVKISRVNAVTLSDLGGDVRIQKITGGVTITRNATGDVLLEDIGGTAAVQQDLGGNLELRRVGGNVVIQRSETLRILVKDVRGDVVIWNDGPGDIEIENVQGDLFIQSDHGGKVVYHRIHGSIHLPEHFGL
ncbi:MAG TPA: hypothetical protein VMW87_13005 [Spirochaetia bacterium]|nr:hypothetical protein [Spirochaetia bacterium]